ncbi:MAG: tetratricopeptide repeat protein [Pyrinomonadaceae bacterium]
MNRLIALIFCFFVTVLQGYGQTWGCPEKDYKCQLDVRMRALQSDPKNPENYYNLGIVFQRSGAHKEAIESFSMYIVIPGVKPELQADGYNNRGISQRALKRPELAYDDYTKAIELNSKKPEFLVNRGNASADMKKFDQAFGDYQRAITLDPRYAQAYAQRGILYSTQARIDDALRDFAKSIELDPKYAEPYYNRGTIYFQRKEWAKAIPDFDKYVGLAESPSYLADGYMNRGICHYYNGNKQKALEDFSKVIEIQPTQPKAYQARAMLYREMKKDDLAAADERKAAELATSQR